MHIPLPERAIQDAGCDQFGARAAPGIRIDIDADDAPRPAGQQLQQIAAAAADVQQLSKRRRHGQLDEVPVQLPVFEHGVSAVVGRTHRPQRGDIGGQDLVVGNEPEQLTEYAAVTAFRGRAIEDVLPVPESRQQARIAQRLQVLRHARLAQADDPGQFGDRAYARRTQRDQPQSDRVRDSPELRDQFLIVRVHRLRIRIKI